MTTIKMTSKRQATFPIELCEDLGLRPGDELIVESAFIQGGPAWILKPRENKLEWMGALKNYADSKSHDIDDIRRRIGRAGRK